MTKSIVVNARFTLNTVEANPRKNSATKAKLTRENQTNSLLTVTTPSEFLA